MSMAEEASPLYHVERRGRHAEPAGYVPTTIPAIPVTADHGLLVGVPGLADRQERPSFGPFDEEVLGRFTRLSGLAPALRRTGAVHGLLLRRALPGAAWQLLKERTAA